MGSDDPFRKYFELAERGEPVDPQDLTPVDNLFEAKNKINDLVALSIRVSVEQRHTARRIEEIEATLGTIECQVRLDMEHAIKHNVRILSLERAEADRRDARWKLTTLFGGMILTVLLTFGSGLWWLRGVSAQVDHGTSGLSELKSSFGALETKGAKIESTLVDHEKRLEVLSESDLAMRAQVEEVIRGRVDSKRAAKRR